MKPYLVSLGVGLLVGVIYALFKVRSPAPPVIALVGLLGMLLGEQIPLVVRHLVAREAGMTSLADHVRPHLFGALPGANGHVPADTAPPPPARKEA
jgi:XapX domain-containing protein